MPKIDPACFEHTYKQMLYVLYSHDPNAKPSFISGEWDNEEGYKRHFWLRAREKMQLDTWHAHRKEPMYIVSRACQPFEMTTADNTIPQNLVSAPNYLKAMDIYYEHPTEAADALYDVFFGKDERGAFLKLSKLLSRKWMNEPLSVIAFYFFLKDRERFVTVKRKTLELQLGKLNLSSSCIQSCTWEGYMVFLSYIGELQALLKSHIPETTFSDAQSFLWMLWMINSQTPEYTEPKEDAIPDEEMEESDACLTSSVVEGGRVECYSTHFERNRKLRNEAIKVHGLACAVCGFDFEKNYGDLGLGFIEVHHTKPLGSVNERHPVNPRTDLVCLCPNCHRMIHRAKDRIMTVEELKVLWQSRHSA